MGPRSVPDPALRFFFDERASQISAAPDLMQLCYVSGKEPRLWLQPAIMADLLDSLCEQLDLRSEHSLLEVGCAAGFLALPLARRCKDYVGVDVSSGAIGRAARLGITNARFQVADGCALPFADNSFDRVLCYDVFMNFDGLEAVGTKMIQDMMRVVKPGGRIMVGSLPDAARQEEYPGQVQKVLADLDRDYGPAPKPQLKQPNLLERIRHWWLRRNKIEPKVLNYYHKRDDYAALGNGLRVPAQILEVHPRNPYRGYRFNAVYHKPVSMSGTPALMSA